MRSNKYLLLSTVAAISTILLSLLVIFGWLTHNESIIIFLKNGVRCKFNTALGILLCGVVILVKIQIPQLGKVLNYLLNILSLLVVGIALLTLSEYLSGYNIGIDEWFVKENLPSSENYFPGRMSPISSINLILLGTGLFLFNKEKSSIYQFIYLSIVVFVSVLMLFDFNFITDIPDFIRLSINAALGFIFLAFSLFFGQPKLRSRINFEKKLYVAFIGALLLVIIISFLTNHYNNKRNQFTNNIIHTNNILYETAVTQALSKELQSGTRAYIITADPEYLKDYSDAKNNIFLHIQKLRLLTKKDTALLAKIDTFNTAINRRIDYSEKCIKIRDQEGFIKATEFVGMGLGKELSFQLQRISGEIQQKEYSKLQNELEDNAKSIAAFNFTFSVLLLCMIFMLVFIFIAIHNNSKIRKQALEKTLEAESQIKTIYATSPDPVIVINELGRIITWNQQSTKLFGWTEAEALHHSIAELIIPPQYKDAHTRGLKNHLLTGESNVLGKNIEIEAITKEGNIIQIDLCIAPAVENGQKIFIGFIRDITAKKLADSKLKENESTFSTLFFKSPVMKSIMDIDTNCFVEANESFCGFVGFKREEIIGMTPEKTRELLNPEVQEKILHGLRKEGYARNIEMKIKLMNGEVKWISFNIDRLIINGKTCNLTAFTDITEIKHTEEQLITLSQHLEEKVKERTNELVKSEKHFRETIDNMLEGVQIIGFDWKYIYVNNAMAKHGKYRKEELIGQTVMQMYPGIEQTDIYKIYQRCFNERVSIHLENEFVFPDQSIGWFELSFQPVHEGIIIVSIDISERKRAEQALHQLNEKLEEKVKIRTSELEHVNHELEAFSYSVSHDLRAPLRAIVGFTSILEEDFTSKLGDEALRITHVIKNNTQKMGQLIDDLLTFSRLGRQEIIKSQINTASLVNEIIHTVYEGNEYKKISWKILELVPCFGDANTLRQVWINLISNAVKYSQLNPQPQIEIGSYTDNQQIIFYIKDNGVGFNNQYKDKLFKVFQRLHSSHEFEGTGVGLAIIEKIISKHGGRVWADGKVDQGANFFFSLPSNLNNHIQHQ